MLIKHIHSPKKPTALTKTLYKPKKLKKGKFKMEMFKIAMHWVLLLQQDVAMAPLFMPA